MESSELSFRDASVVTTVGLQPLGAHASSASGAAALIQRHRRRTGCDLGGLTRDLLIALRRLHGLADRALLIVRLFSELEPTVHAHVAFAVATRLTPYELARVGRAGLLELKAACDEAGDASSSVAARAIARALPPTPVEAPKRSGGVLVYGEGVRREVLLRARRQRAHRLSAGVLFVASADDARLGASDWCLLLRREARLSGSARLERFAELATGGRRHLVSERELAPRPTFWRRLLGAVASWWHRELVGEDRLPHEPRLGALG